MGAVGTSAGAGDPPAGQGPAPYLPEPTGPSPVGTTSLQLTDTSRPDPWAVGVSARELMVSLPQSPETGAVLPEIHYLEKEQLTALLVAIPKDSVEDAAITRCSCSCTTPVQECRKWRTSGWSWLTLAGLSKSSCSGKAANGGRARCG